MEKTETSRLKLKWRLKLRKVHLLIPVFLILLTSFLSLLPSSIPGYISLVHAQESSLEVYMDPDGTSPLRDIYWGVLYPSQSVMRTIYVKNFGTTEESLSLATGNWSPPEAQTYLSLTWNYDGSKLGTNEIRETTLTLNVSPDIKEITDFSFDIHIATEFTEPQPPTSEVITDLTIDVSPSTVSAGEDLTVSGELMGEYATSYVLTGVIKDAPISLSTTWGLEQNKVTRSDGSFIFQINAPTEGGDYTITVSFDGDDYFASCQATTTVTVTSPTPTPTPPPTYALTISSSLGGTTSSAPGSYLYDEGTSVQVTAIPDLGYNFDRWELDGITYSTNPITIIMDSNNSLLASFSVEPPPPPPTYTLNISSTTGGTTDPVPGVYQFDEGTPEIVTAIPDAGYVFAHWELNGVVRTENPLSITMNQDHTLLAVFNVIPPVEYTLSISTSLGGTTSPIPGDYSIAEGTSVQVTAVEDVNFNFNHWELDGIPYTTNPITVLMDGDHTLLATFTEEPTPTPTPFSVNEYIEAEDGYTNRYTVIGDDLNAGGGKYVETPDGMGWDDLGIMKYDINVEEAGTYRLWIRAKWTDGRGNSYALDFDRETSEEWQEWIDDSTYIISDDVYGVWHWLSKDLELTKGTHTLVFQTREDGVALDRILVTNEGVTPRG